MNRAPSPEPRAPKLILALDVDNLDKAKYFVEKLSPKVKIFKVGLELFTGCGPAAVEMIHRAGAEVFLDLKFFDIPNTVSSAIAQATRLKVKMLTLHIAGGEEMLKSALLAARKEAQSLKIERPLLIGVTVLTSQKSTPGEVLTRARLGLECGLDGVVCSGREAEFLREEIQQDFLMVTPGIRLNAECGMRNAEKKDDQKRITTPEQAVKAGSDFLVVGRPILEALDLVKAVNEILKEMEG